MEAHPIESYMSEFPVVVAPDTSVTRAIDLMRECGFRHLPVVQDRRVVGIVSERDLRQAELLCEAMTLTVSDYMTARPYCVAPEAPLASVVREMHHHRWGCAIVCDGAGRVRGIFTATDALGMLADALERGSVSSPRSSIEDFLERQRREAALACAD